jgi:hypothetical protein
MKRTCQIVSSGLATLGFSLVIASILIGYPVAAYAFGQGCGACDHTLCHWDGFADPCNRPCLDCSSSCECGYVPVANCDCD